MALVDEVAKAFDTHGLLADSIPNYLVRSGQVVMATEVARTMQSGGVLVVEAATGVGKTFAYLVPALLSGERVLVSTATKALQDQLYQRDIPKLLEVLGTTVQVALLKGRSSYLCLNRLGNARLGATFNDPIHLRQLAAIESWALATQSGDLAEVAMLDEQSPAIPLVSSTRDNCLGGRCPQASACHVNVARRNAMAADVIVVNHHLFFADLNVRESGVAELLPTASSVIFDEAHQINEIGVQFMGQQFSTGQLESFAVDVDNATSAHAKGFADWGGIRTDVIRASDRWRASVGRVTGRVGWAEGVLSGSVYGAWVDAMAEVTLALTAIQRALAVVSEISPELSALHERSDRLLDCLDLFRGPCAPDCVRWIEVGSHMRLYQSPLDIAQTMRDKVLSHAFDEANRKSWIFTSATLGHEPTLRWFIESCGLTNAKVLKIESPFDYAQQAALYVPEDMPPTSNSLHPGAVAHFAAKGALVLGGRTLVLTTTLRSMRLIGVEIRSHFALVGSDIEVWVQGEAPKQEIIRTMNLAHGSKGCVVVASVSFWEGVDIPGAALQLLVVDKLPFVPPDDPIQQSRAKQLEKSGKSPFRELHLPQAAVALKQGAGRLIRRETDKGILVVCDVRLSTMGYGKKLIAALPPMRRLLTQDQYQDALEALTKPSTTGLDSLLPLSSKTPT
jgi:ATP-dependent DNA helicase DinG